MTQNLIRPPKRLWILAVFNITMVFFALAVNLFWIYPRESSNTISYLWVYPYPSFLFLTIIISSVGILFGGNNWRMALVLLVSIYFGGKVIDQLHLIFTSYDSMVDSIFKGEIFALLVVCFELFLNYIVLFSKKSNLYFSLKNAER